MPKWIGVITNDGNDLLSEWANEKTLNFDKVIFGTGTVATEAMMAQSDLVSQKQVAGIVGSERVDSGIRLKIQITASDVSYVLNQIGIWASVENAEPVMLALYQYTTGVSVPSKVESPEFVYTFYALVSTSNQGQWTVSVDTSALVTQEQLNSHIKDKNNPHGMTCEQIGAAPAGYGLGESNGKRCEDCNTALNNGFYNLSGESCKNVPTSAQHHYGTMIVESRGSTIIHHTVNRLNVIICRYSADDGATWSEWEWGNPPLDVGVEYRTTERFGSKPVYAKRLNFGKGATGQKAVDITTGHIDSLVRIEGSWSDGTNKVPFNDPYCVIGITADNYNTNARIIVDMVAESYITGYTGYPVVYYTKS